jgi:hypothetical protein
MPHFNPQTFIECARWQENLHAFGADNYNAIRRSLLSLKSRVTDELGSTDRAILQRTISRTHHNASTAVHRERDRLWSEAHSRFNDLLREQPLYPEFLQQQIQIQERADNLRAEALRVRDAALAALEEN